jgi:hypothetical protein
MAVSARAMNSRHVPGWTQLRTKDSSSGFPGQKIIFHCVEYFTAGMPESWDNNAVEMKFYGKTNCRNPKNTSRKAEQRVSSIGELK